MHHLFFQISHFSSASNCSTSQSNVLGFPNWYRGLQCEDGGSGGVVFEELNDLWIIVANVLDISLRLAGIIAVLFLIIGGISYIMSQGEPANLQKAKTIIVNSIIGLVVAIMASTIVGFIAGSL